VTETSAPIADDSRTSTAARVGWAILILSTLYVCYFSHLGAIGFVGPDEPRYAWIARDMAETGDWVTPRLYGKPWFEKPPLLYWGAALSFKLFGVSEAAARLPSAISALLATLALAWLALRLYGAETARWFLLFLPSTVGMIGFSHAAATDMPFSAMLTIAMVCAAVVLGLTRNEHTPILPRTPWLALLLFGFFLGLAVLAKGPVAIILSGGAVFFWALFTKHWRDAFRLFHPVAIASFCLTALPWYILCARRNSDFLRIFIIEHNFNRYLTSEFQHIQPFWYFGPILLAAFLPWTLLLLWSIVSGSNRSIVRRAISELSMFFLSWAMFTLVFFSVSQSKLPGYILPAVPAIGLLLVRKLVLSFASRSRFMRFGGIPFACITSAALVFGTLETKLHVLHPDQSVPFRTVYGAFFVLNLLGFGCGLLGLRRTALILLQLAVLASIASLRKSDLDLADTEVSARGAFTLGTNTAEHSPVHSPCAYGLTRSMQYQLNFYLHHEIPVCSPPALGFATLFVSRQGKSQFETSGFWCGNGPVASHPDSSKWVVCRTDREGSR
jgi:4-amino-4-deoxy-L-arabinose transferase-like glycosyltransferase